MSVPRCASSTSRSSAAATSSKLFLRAQRADRPARFDHVRAREVDRGLEAARDGRWQRRRGSLGALQLHQDGGEALRERVVDVARQAVALFEHGLTARLGLALFGELALMERERRLARHRVEQRAVPRATVAERHASARQREPSQVARRQDERRDEHDIDPVRRVERADRLGQARRRRPCTATISVHPGRCARRWADMLSLGSASAFPSPLPRV